MLHSPLGRACGFRLFPPAPRPALGTFARPGLLGRRRQSASARQLAQRLVARATACALLSAPSLDMIWRTWYFAVRSVMLSLDAICLFERPSPTSRITSRS